MIEAQCECCDQRVLFRGPPARTPLERIQFEKDWDRRYEEGKSQ